MPKNCYTIGQIATICDISIQGLRYYDKINLLKPSEKNVVNCYRYYTDKDIVYLRIIQDLKETGFTLDEIKEIIKTENIQVILDVLSRKRKEFQEKLQSLSLTLEKIDGRITNLQLGKNAVNNVNRFLCIEIKKLPARKIAYTRYQSNNDHETLALRFYELDKIVKEYTVIPKGPRMALYHDFSDICPENLDLEVCVPVDGDPEKNETCLRTIEADLYTTAIYQGEYLGQCEALEKWIYEHHYQITGPAIEIYLNSFMNTRFPKQFVTEIQIPVKSIDPIVTTRFMILLANPLKSFW
jgi:DNA-binding transcriptional MerR regulator